MSSLLHGFYESRCCPIVDIFMVRDSEEHGRILDGAHKRASKLIPLTRVGNLVDFQLGEPDYIMGV